MFWVSSKPMDLNTLSRRELQALCKSNGIPANKTNVFMVDALAKKRIPLSKIDANRTQTNVSSIGSPPLKTPSLLLARKCKNVDVNSTGSTQQKPPLFQNNFLRRGKRKDVPTSHESGHEEKPETQQQSVSTSQRPHQMVSTRTETIAAQSLLCPNQIVSTNAKGDSGLSGLTSETLSGTTTRHAKVESRLKSWTRSGGAAKDAHVIASGATSFDETLSDGSKNGAKRKIEDRVRFQIDAALCSKVMKAPESWPPAQVSLESSERSPEPNVKVDTVDSSECLDLPLAHQEKQGDNLLRAPVESPEQQMESFSVSQSLVGQTGTREENPLTSTLAVNPAQRSLEVITPSPPISFSPLVRVEEKVRSIVERVQNFWKGSRDLAVVNSFGSPVQ